MTEYTEDRIRELSGRELGVAVHRLVLKKKLAECDFCEGTGAVLAYRGEPSQGTEYVHCMDCGGNGRADPLEMPLDWCVLELMGKNRILNGYRLMFWAEWKVRDAVGKLVASDLSDPAAAIMRAACIVKLREGE